MICEDAVQLFAMQNWQRNYQDLIVEEKKRAGFTAVFRKPQLIQGVYLRGGVGIGKTILMDCFYHCLPFSHKLRMHFYQFMQLIHS